MSAREEFSSRFGFILVSVACAVGLGNIWLLPYRVAVFGGGAYLLLFVIFVFLFSLPCLMAEFALGRGSGQSIITAHKAVQPKSNKWQFHGWMGLAGNYLLVMFYSVVVGFTLNYMFKAISGQIVGMTAETAISSFSRLVSSPAATLGWTWAVVILSITICFFGVQKGIERFGKTMMIIFFFLIIVLVIRGLTLPGAMAGVVWMFVPRMGEAITNHGLDRLLHMAMGQAFFSLSVGMGGMTIFASYIRKKNTIGSEAVPVSVIDVSVSLVCLLMIFPAAFAQGITEPTAGSGLLFVVMPGVLNAMPGGIYFWSVLFYVSVFFLAVTTLFSITECVIAMGMDKFGWTRKKSVFINLCLLMVLIIPGALSQSFGTAANIWNHIRILGMPFGAFWTFLVTENIMPIGAIVYAIFCSYKFGWGWDNFLAEVNTGNGWKLPRSMRFWFAYVIPIAGLFVYFFGLFVRFIRPLLG